LYFSTGFRRRHVLFIITAVTQFSLVRMSSTNNFNIILTNLGISRGSIHSFIHSSMALRTLLDPGLFFSFVIFFTQSVGLLGRGISPSQGRYLHTGEHKHRINAHTGIRALSGIWSHDSNVRAWEDSSCLRPRGHCDRLQGVYLHQIPY
jgi:hypothetical protein